MAFSRKQMAAAVAGTLSLAMLTGCPAAAPTGTGTPSPSVAPPASAAPSAPVSAAPASTAPGASPTAPASVDPNASPTTPTATASAPAPSGKLVIVSGNIYDEDGATVDGALVTVKSLDASVPYTATATSQAGSWVVNNVPEGANVEIVATKDGWTSRRRVGSFQQQATGRRNVINFGAAGGSADNDDEDPTGEAYFISDYPEITMTTPADEAKDVDNTKVSVKVTFSEALTEDSRENFEDVFTILPASADATAADSGTVATNLEDGEDNSMDDLDAGDIASDALSGFEYALQEGDAFLGSTQTKMTASWNSEGTEVTFTFGGALLADENDAAEYQIALVVDNAGDEIEDEDGNQLGTDGSGVLDASYDADDLIYNAFKEADLSINNASGASNDGDENWSYTHDTVSNFEVREDDTAPKLTSVDVTEEGTDQRIELTFSEPLAAYGGTSTGIYGTGLFDIANYTFAVGEDRGDLDDVDLEGDEEAEVASGLLIPTTATTVLNLTGDATQTNNANEKDEFYFDPSNVVSTDQASDISDLTTAGTIFMEVDEDNPQTLFIWIANIGTFFDEVNEIKARVEGVNDPAGNEIEEADADANVVSASI